LHLHATDDGLGPSGEWTITSDKQAASRGRTTRQGRRCAARPAKDLLLAVVRRRTAAEGAVEVFGDTAVWDGWLEHTPF